MPRATPTSQALPHSSDFPTTPGAFQTTFGELSITHAFVSKLNAAGSALVYSTYLGGNGETDGSGIAVDASGNAYVTGQTGSPISPPPRAPSRPYRADNVATRFVSKLNAPARPWSTPPT